MNTSPKRPSRIKIQRLLAGTLTIGVLSCASLNIARYLLPLLPLTIGACSPKFVDIEANTAPKSPHKGGIAEFRLISYNGEDLKARVLLGATQEPLPMDARMMEYIYVELRELRECGKEKLLSYYHFDIVYPPIREDQQITIQPGYWYGSDLSFHLFDKELIKDSPACFEGKLMIRSREGRLAATLPIQVSRTDMPVAPPEPKTIPPQK